jgi:TonB-linked SusC/RagA family outer membrane protein
MDILLIRQRIKLFLSTILFLLLSAHSVLSSPGKFPAIQNVRITISSTNQPVLKVFEELTKQSGMVFFYNEEILEGAGTVTLDAKNAPFDRVLHEISQQTNLTFKQIDNTISVGRKPPVANVTLPPQVPQPVVVSGRITDTAGQPMPGVSIVIKGTNKGVVSDIDGHYSINVGSEGVHLVFSFIGYMTKEIVIEGQRSVNLIMEEELKEVEEIVVVGYGTQKKINLTGSVSAIQGDILESRPVAAVGTGLQGLLPGVTITSPSGQPGSPGTSIVVRGINTINSQTNPLILIDGVAGGDINLVNPDDIESVTVLKDAASSAIYGARAANGVILITTKRGKSEGKASFSYSGYFGIQTPTSLPELVDGRQYMTLSNEARAARGVAIPYTDEAFMKYDSKNFLNDYSNTDWVSETYKKYATQQSHNFNINGRSERSSYYMSYGYLNQSGLVVGDPYASTRHNVRLRLNTELSDRFRVDGNISFIDFYRKDAGSSGTGGVFRLVQRISPLLPVKWQLPTEDGGWTDSPYWSYGSVSNPVRVAYESGYVKNYSRTFNGNFNASLDLIKGMNVNAQYAYNYYTRDVKDWSPTMPRFLADGTPHPSNDNAVNTIAQSHRSILTQTFNTTLNYEKQIEKHGLKFLAGFSQEWARQPSLSASRQKVLLDGIEVIDAGTENIQNSGTEEHWALRSWFGRLNYDYAAKYLLEANVRYDGTSRFSKDNRWGVFPSFSAGWRFSEEEFMAFSRTLLNSGKFRASWGELGNQNISDNYYPYLTEIERVEKAYPIGNKENIGFTQNSLANEHIKWETIRMLNFGLDLQLLDNRLEMSFDWFKKENVNALLKPIFPSVIGITASDNLPLENIGSIENKGWEIAFSWRDKIGQVRYGFTANLSDAKNKITNLGNSAPSLGDNIRRVGDPINAYYGYRTDGLAQVADFESYNESTKRYENPKFPIISSYAAIIQPGDVVYRDLSGENGQPDGKIDDYDKVVFGNPYPRYSYSLRGFAEWKNFDFSFYIQGVGKVNGYLAEEARHAFINDYSIPKTVHLDRWTPNNPGASYPRMYYQPSHNIVFSNYWLENASYLRLKNIQLGYTLPRPLLNRINVNRLKVYVSIDNLFTLTDYFGGFDPEVRETSGDSYPQLKTFALGVQLGF